VRETPARRTKGLPRRLELRNAVRIARRRHLPQMSVDVGRVAVGKNGGFMGRHLVDRMTELVEKPSKAIHAQVELLVASVIENDGNF
jgi:hypothetical protein